MTEDIAALIERLLAYAKDQGGWHNIDETCEAAATALAAQSERIAALEKERDAVAATDEEVARAVERLRHLARLADAMSTENNRREAELDRQTADLLARVAAGRDEAEAGLRAARKVAEARTDWATAAEARAEKLEAALRWLAAAFENYCNDLGHPSDSYQRDCIEKARRAAIGGDAPMRTPDNRKETAMTNEQIKHMVERFLSWKLPEDFKPDGGITFTPEFNVEYMASLGKPPSRHEPTGTNLLDYRQAEAMVRHIVDGLPRAAIGGDHDLT